MKFLAFARDAVSRRFDRKRILGFEALPLVLWGGASAALSCVPLAGAPGYESALVFGLVSSLWVPLATRLDRRFDGAPLSRSLLDGARYGACHALVSVAVLSVRAFFEGFCDGVEGVAFFLLGAGLGMPLGGALGGAARTLGRKRSFLGSLDWWVPSAFFLAFALEFYFTPAVYGFSPFVGVFLGPLYDTIYFPWARLLSYRLGSLSTFAAFALFAVAREAARIGDVGRTQRAGRWGFAALLAALLVAAAGARLGHRTSSTALAEALGATVEGGRCVVHYDQHGVGVERARLLAEECSAHVAELEEDLGTRRGERRFVVFLFKDESQKAELFGARSTNVAKPWRGEVYVRNEPFPHPVLRHELAHAVSSELGRGPLAIAGRFGGMLPDPGRIEGLAVYAAGIRGPEAQDLLGWARAQRDAGHLPSLTDIFGLGFYRNAAPNAYTAAGAFFAFLRRRYGPEGVADFYGDADADAWFGKTLSTLEREFLEELERTKPDPRLRKFAEQRFSQKAIFARRCPQRVGRLVDALAAGCDGSPEALEAPLSELRRLDAADYDVRLSALGCGFGQGAEGLARELHRELQASRDDLAPWQLASLLEIDALESPAPARDALLARAIEMARHPRVVRHLALLRFANGVDEATWSLFVELLRGRRDKALFEAAARLEVADAPAALRYLRGKAALAAGAEQRAFADFAQVLGNLPHPELEEEARRSLALASCRSKERRARARTELETISLEEDERRKLDALLAFCDRGTFDGR